MKSRIGLVALWATLLSQSANAQLLAVSPGANQGMVAKASCESCNGDVIHHSASGVYGGSDIVWGVQCGMRRGLYPPCPNPCHTTLLGGLCCDLKNCIDQGLSQLSCCLLGHAAIGCGHNSCRRGGCGTNRCCDDVCCDSSMTTSAAPTEATTVPTAAQPDPFQDDPQMPNVHPIPNGSASRNAIPHQTTHRPIASKTNQTVKRVTHAAATSPPAPTISEGQSILAKPIRRTATKSRHYAPRRQALLRTSDGGDLVKTPVARTAASNLKLR